MITSPMQGVVQQLRRAVLARDGAGLTDGQLLTLFIEARDEGAFEALVRRHGAMVMGVCRRVLGNPDDADDAFQATFLVLVRKATSIVPREMLANWLYGVARTTALRANALTAKRRLRERQVRIMPEPEAVSPDLWNDLQPLLDQELGRLPEKYRVAIVLCDLEGKSHKEAAWQLGWPQGTLSGRLVRGRKMLAKRLARHGLALSAGALAGVLSQNAASASVPTSLVSSTVKAASLLAAGKAAVVGLVSSQAAALTEGVVMTMLLNKIKTVTLVLLIAALLGGAGMFYRIQAAQPANGAPAAAGAPTADEESDRDKNPEQSSSEPSGQNKLSSAPMPWQALVSLEKGKVLVRTLSVVYEPITRQLEGGAIGTSYQQAEIMKTVRYDTDAVKVYDVRGKRIHTKELPGLLKKETVALASMDAHAADPLNLRLFKEGTLLFVLPSPLAPTPPPGPVEAFPSYNSYPAPQYEPPLAAPPARPAPSPTGPSKKP